jgi:hypothetical protein
LFKILLVRTNLSQKQNEDEKNMLFCLPLLSEREEEEEASVLVS